MTLRIGVNPIGWSNDDLRELGGHISLETCLGEARGAGFSGIELGHKFPRAAAQLRPILEAHDIGLVGGWYSTELLRRDVRAEIAAAQDHLGLLRDMGCTLYIIAEISNAIHGDISAPLSKSPLLTAGDWPGFGARMTEFCKFLRDQGFAPAYHHHMGTVVETPDEIARFMDSVGEEVGLLLDTGHAAFAKADPVALARTYGPRITHVHCKDLRLRVRDAALARDASFLDAVVDGVFTVPGDGDVDFPAVLSEMSRVDYTGWLVVEAEQDPDKADPKTYAEMGYANLNRMAAEAGFH